MCVVDSTRIYVGMIYFNATEGLIMKKTYGLHITFDVLLLCLMKRKHNCTTLLNVYLLFRSMSLLYKQEAKNWVQLVTDPI